MQNRIVLAPSKAALLWRFLCLHFIYLCTSWEFVGLVRGCAELAWQRVEGTHDAYWWGNQKLSMDSRITTKENGCISVGICMWSCQCESVWKTDCVVLLCMTEADECDTQCTHMAVHMSKSTTFLLTRSEAALLTFLVDQQQR